MTSAVIDTGGPGLEFDSNGMKNHEVRQTSRLYLLTRFILSILNLKEKAAVSLCVKWARGCLQSRPLFKGFLLDSSIIAEKWK